MCVTFLFSSLRWQYLSLIQGLRVSFYISSHLWGIWTLHMVGDDSMTHLASFGMPTNSLRVNMTLFFFLLCKMLPLESWVSTCRVFLRKSIPTYEEICTWSLFVALASSLNLMCCLWFYCTFMRYSFLIGTVFVISMVFGLYVATDAFIHLNSYLIFSHVVAFMKLYLSYFCLMYFAYLNLQ